MGERRHRAGRCARGACGGAGLVPWLLAAALVAPAPGAAQLISPGKLTGAHVELEGIRSCTSCHELGKQGVAPAKCLECHELVRTRIAGRRGYHARVADRNCGECHKEHFGRDFDMVHLDTATFRHGETGYELRGGHGRVSCRECHTPERVSARDVREYGAKGGFLRRTMLGLPTACAACHAPEDPHGRQFAGRRCDDCHDEREWNEPARFDHARTAYPLTGLHRRVACGGCHTPDGSRDGAPVRYVGLEFGACTSCHQDPHGGRMGATCTGCHTTDGWHRLASKAIEGRFDHDRTRFRLAGRHAAAECGACHGRPAPRTAAIRIRFAAGTEEFTYPRPIASACASCHVDHHGGEFRRSAGGGACEGCHGERGWTPTTYDIARHNRGAAFRLTGAHVATPCAECHQVQTRRGTALRFRIANRECKACHTADDPHGRRYARFKCEDCHSTESFRAARFDHKRVRGQACRDCHAPDDPHGRQFAGVSCDGCHSTETFRIARFDHGRTRFPLDGAHARVACAGCHTPGRDDRGRAVIIYKPLGTECRDCHGGGD